MGHAKPLLLGLTSIVLFLLAVLGSPSVVGALSPPIFQGWAGRCSGGSGCDASVVNNEHSLGFACSQATCTRGAFTFGDGNGQFFNPGGAALDSNANLYVVETSNQRVQVLTSNGAFVTKWGASGTAPGQFTLPRGIAVNQTTGAVYVADTGNHRIQQFTSTGAFVNQWGIQGPGNGQFSSPQGIAVDAAGNVYVADTQNHRVQVFNSSGTYLSQWGTLGSGDGQFSAPSAVAVDRNTNSVYVVDVTASRVQKFTTAGVFVTKWGSSGSGNGQFSAPSGVGVSPDGNVYVADTFNDRIQAFTSAGAYLTQWGTAGSGDGQFNNPRGVVIDGSGFVYVADSSNNRLQKFSPAPEPTATLTSTATVTPTITLTPSTHTLAGSMLLQGRPAPPSNLLAVPLRVQFFQTGNATPVLVATPVADNGGNFTVNGVPSGTFNVQVKQAQSLSVQASGVAFGSIPTGGLGPLDTVNRSFGTLPTGDSDNNNLIDIVDFSLLRAVFGNAATCGTANPPATTCADYDASGFVDIVDFSLLRSNFGRTGPVPVA
jgi:DNA-binding beta-propeller fold protein YncE